MIKLSICIPTYNRAHTLVYLLSSIVREIQSSKLDDYIEVIISDNASTDNTRQLVESFSNKIKNINYIRSDQNNGFGINITNAVSYARGEFCWLMGSDEVLCDGVLIKLLDIIMVSNSEIILGNAITNGVERHFYTNPGNFSDISSVSGIISFIDNCTELSSCFAFISTIVIKKTIFDGEYFPESYISHPYTHLIRIFFNLKFVNCRVELLGWPLVDTGSEVNEWNSIIFNHFKLDYQTAHLVCHSVFSDDEEIKSSFSELLKRQYSPLKMIVSRACTTQEQWRDIVTVLQYFKIPNYLYEKAIYDPLIRVGYKIIKKTKGILRNVKY
ncbi:glycosyltransferase family 2 protein [Aeromonas hydrophila]|uniref:glycosyltransferase family 2 protein n=1 Tax=Aeromonas hydrophila TaxID=644 RepID=UPI0030192D3B